MKVRHAACLVHSSVFDTDFIGIVVFDAEEESVASAINAIWGTGSFVRELDAMELRRAGKDKSIFTASRLAS